MFIGPTVGVIEQSTPGSDTCIVTIGGEADWVARYLAGLPVDFEVLDPPEVRDELQALAGACSDRRTDQPFRPADVVTPRKGDDIET